MGCHSLLQGIFLTQGSNSSLLSSRWILYHLSHQGRKCAYRNTAPLWSLRSADRGWAVGSRMSPVPPLTFPRGASSCSRPSFCGCGWDLGFWKGLLLIFSGPLGKSSSVSSLTQQCVSRSSSQTSTTLNMLAIGLCPPTTCVANSETRFHLVSLQKIQKYWKTRK